MHPPISPSLSNTYIHTCSYTFTYIENSNLDAVPKYAKIVAGLPSVSYETLKVLFHHLNK